MDKKSMDASSDEAGKAAFEEVIQRALWISADVAEQVNAILRLGLDEPLSDEDAESLVTRVVEVMREGAGKRQDHRSLEALDGEMQALVRRVLAGRRRARLSTRRPSRDLPKRLAIEAVGPVVPTPTFHGKEVPMTGGFVKTSELQLWEGNERLDIHLEQFRKAYGREPSSGELLEIMLSKMPLAGLTGSDQFEIETLAGSIAVNGVRRPPIIDIDGVLLDGNRRVAACYYILNGPNFGYEEKRRAERLFVWQLTEHSDEDDRRRVVVSLNFESDYKQPWPSYVKARKVYEDWQAMLALEPHPPGAERMAHLKRELSLRYALGPDARQVNRYIKMVEWADDFEEYLVQERQLDEYEVKHNADEHFEYFDELSKGVKPGGVAHALGEDEDFKQLVFDLLYQDKFRNWRIVRDLKYAPGSPEALSQLRAARDEGDVRMARQIVDGALAFGVSRRAEVRQLGADQRIASFTKFLEELPPKTFRDHVRPESLRGLLRALRLVEGLVRQILGEKQDP